MIKLRALVAKGQKSSNAPQFGILLFCGQTTYRNGPFQGIFRGGQDFFWPLNCPERSIFKISGAIIV